jgi:hypothetical protein
MFCRVLRQIGQGSIEAGVREVIRSTSFQANVSTILDIPLPVLAEELAHLPQCDPAEGQIDLGKMYSHLVAGTAEATVDAEEELEHLTIFKWCANLYVITILMNLSSAVIFAHDWSRAGHRITQKYSVFSLTADREISPIASIIGSPAVCVNTGSNVLSRYDEGNKGFLDLDDLKRVLHDLGMLEGHRDKDHYVASQLAMASKSAPNTLSPSEFSSYYSSLVFAGAHTSPVPSSMY